MTNVSAQKPRPVPWAALLFALGLFLSCLYGGYIVTDQTTLTGGLGGLIAEIFGGTDAPLLSHTVIALPILGALVWCLVTRRAQQFPGQIFTSIWLLFFLFLGASTLLSSFRALSLYLWLEWLVYGAAAFAAVATLGRNRGPTLALSGIALGCALVALKGIAEYGQARAGNPSWRIFAGWMDPNAVAAMLLIGFFISVGLCLSSERLNALLLGLAAALIAFAIFLTGSKGVGSLGLPIGTIALGVGLCRKQGGVLAAWTVAGFLLAAVVGVLFVKNVGWLGFVISALFAIAAAGTSGVENARKLQVLRIAACYLSAIVLVILLAVTTPAPGASDQAAKPGAGPAIAATPIARIAEGAGTEQQSAAFRMNLWKSARYLIETRPLTGYGMGAYRYESGRAGLSTATVFAHNSYLQIWAECGFAPILLFIAGMTFWFWTVLKNHTTIPTERAGPFAGVVAAIVAILAHSMIDSDLYYFGIGLCFFALLGIALLLSVDSVAPEFVPASVRGLAVGGLCALFAGLVLVSYMEAAKAQFRGDLEAGDRSAAAADEASVTGIGAFDGDADYLLAETSAGSERLRLLELAYKLSPQEKVARALATSQLENGESAGAVATLQEALKRDPDNLITLNTLMRLQMNSGDQTGAVDTAERLIGVEQTPYFKVRSIPESVPTETYMARFDVLAPAETNSRKRADLLAAGVRGMLGYAEQTTRIIFQNSGNGKLLDQKEPGYDSLTEAREKIEETVKACQDAAQIYKTLGDRAAAAEMDTDGRRLAAALAFISSK